MLFLALSFAVGCSDRKVEPVKLAGFTMGTSYHITVLGDGIDGEQLQRQIDQRLTELNRIFSTYIDDSELSQLNNGEVGEWLAVSPELYEVLALSLRLGELTGGAFDITVGPLVNAWGFGPDKARRSPSDALINELKQRVGYQFVELREGSLVRKQRAVSIDLSAVAKGYAVDQVTQLLADHGYQDFMVEIGGELSLHGHSPRGTPWRIGIEQPGQGYGKVNRAIALSGNAMATSGDYRNYYEVDGQRYSHTIDPVTGKPITHNLASVTVITASSAEADALATALSVMGAEKGLALAQQHGYAIYQIIKSKDGFMTQYSDAFQVYLD